MDFELLQFCKTYSNHASRILLNVLKQIYDLNTNNKHSHKNCYQLKESLNKLKNIKNVVTYYFIDLFNNINLKD